MTSKYDRLAAIGSPVVTLTFAAIEAVVGPLPMQARTYPSRWCAGYVADRPDLPKGSPPPRPSRSDVSSRPGASLWSNAV